MKNIPSSNSKILPQAIIGGAGMAIPPDAGIPPDGWGCVLLYVPLNEIAEKTVIELQSDIGLPWAGPNGKPVWFEQPPAQNSCSSGSESPGKAGVEPDCNPTKLAIHPYVQRIAELESEMMEQARVNGMGSEREARLLARVQELERQMAQYAIQNSTGTKP